VATSPRRRGATVVDVVEDVVEDSVDDVEDDVVEDFVEVFEDDVDFVVAATVARLPAASTGVFNSPTPSAGTLVPVVVVPPVPAVVPPLLEPAGAVVVVVVPLGLTSSTTWASCSGVEMGKRCITVSRWLEVSMKPPAPHSFCRGGVPEKGLPGTTPAWT